MNKLIANWGINDIKGSVGSIYHSKWSDMVNRVKNKREIMRYPTYKNCNICDEWKHLSNFKKWFDINYIHGYVLDKDLYIPNNKLYSPETCLFIPNNINSLINKQKGKGYYKIPSGKYQVLASVNGKQVYLGVYITKEEAYQVYVEYKAKSYMMIADNWIDENSNIYLGLYRNAKYLLKDNWDDFVINNKMFYYPENDKMVW